MALKVKIREIVRDLCSHLYQCVYLLAGSRAACWGGTTGTRGVPSQDKSVVNDRSPSDIVESDDGDIGAECHGGRGSERKQQGSAVYKVRRSCLIKDIARSLILVC